MRTPQSLRVRVTALAAPAVLSVTALLAPAGLAAQPVARPQPAAAGFTLDYESPRTPEFRRYERALQASEVFDAILEDVNSFLTLPREIPVVFAECGEANAFYDGEAQRITLCYELMADFERVFSEAGTSPEEVPHRLLEATAFIFYHEMGHALVHQLELPVTGKEEDAVDDLATVVMINADEDTGGEEMALSAAEAFYLWGAEAAEGPGDEDFADEHSLNQQRYYNILCTVYGSNEEAFAALVEEEVLPAARAERCAGEYQQKSTSWSRLLAEHMKE